MNKKRYRLVFNAARGCLVAVSESALRKSKGAGRELGAGMGNSAVVVLRVATTVALGVSTLSSTLVQAQIMPDPIAPGNQRPTVLSTSNDVPLVNIQTPSAAGVSRNTYEQFDVGSPGAVLNNSRTDVQTQLGGWVQGNPWLAKGEARIILNEVNSNNPSQLKGFIEVGGQRAEVIIANPAGIEVDGAGFINTSRATLTTGSPSMNGGSLDVYRVLRGTVRIGGKGLDASLTDYTGILARAIEVNASIHAQVLDLVTGENNIDANSNDIQLGANTGAAPAFALDVGELGGMYAGQIRLVGTEAGLGVRHHGTMAASVGDIHIDANGQLSSTGAIQANQGDITILTAQDQRYSGSVLAGESLTLHSGGNLSGGNLSGSNHLDEQSGNKLGTIENSGTLRAGQEANLRAGDLNNSGQVDAQRLDIEVDNLSNSGHLWQSGTQDLSIQTTSLVNEQDGFLGRVALPAQNGNIGQPSQSSLQVPDSDETSSSQSSDSLISSSQPNSASKSSSVPLASGAVKVSGSLVNHAGGTLAAEGDLYVSTGQSLSNAGHIHAQSVQASGNWFENTAGTFQADQLNVEVDTVNLSGGAVSAEAATLSSTQHIQNSNAQLYTQSELRLNAQQLSNAGEIQSGATSHLAIANSLTNTGIIAAADDLTIDAVSVDSSGTLAAGLNQDGSLKAFADEGGALSITTTRDLSATGTNLAVGNLTLEGGNVDLHDSQTSANNAYITARDGLVTWQASVVTQERLSLYTSGVVDNTEGTLVSHGGDLSVKALSLNNDQGTLLAGNSLEITLDESLNNTAGTVYAGGNATLDTGALFNTGTLAAANHLTIDATSVDSTGTLAAGLNSDGSLTPFDANSAELSVTATGDLIATGNNLAAGSITLAGNNVDLSESQTSAYNTDITARDTLDIKAATIVTQDSLSLYTSGVVDNTEGTLASHSGDLSVKALSLNNDQGTLLAGNNLEITLDESLGNTAGTVYAGGNATLDTGALFNTGTIAAADNLTIDAASVASSGTLAAGLSDDGSLAPFDANGAELRITTTRDLHATGTNLAAGHLSLAGDAVDLSESQTSAYRADIAARGDLATWQASIVTQESLLLQSDGALDNTGGTLSSKQGDLSVQVLSLNNTDGTAYAGGNTTLDAEQAVDNTRGMLYSEQGDLSFRASSLNSTDGTVYSGGNATLDTGELTSTGTLAAANHLTINATSVDSTGTLAAGLNSNGSLNSFDANGAELSVTATGDLIATGTNLASGNLKLDGGNVGLSESQTSAFDANIFAQGTLDTSSANVVTQQNLILQAVGALDNIEGTLSSQQGDLSVQALSLNNDQGTLLSGNNLEVTLNEVLTNTNGVTNIGGLMVASSELGINANSHTINNTSGVLLAQGNMHLSTDADILNTGGLVQSNAAISLSADTVNNRQTSEDTQGIVGDDVQITANAVDNTDGQVLAGLDLTITADKSIINDRGILNAQGELTLQDGASNPGERHLIISNIDGVIVANNDLYSDAASVAITAKSLDLSGTLESGGDMSLDLVGDLETASHEQINAEGVLSLQLQGDPSSNSFINAGKWEGGRGLVIRADDIINQQSGELQSGGATTLDTQQASDRNVTNRGLINGIDTRISSHTVDNVGSGRIYGDRIAIETNTLTNREETAGGQTQAATIAAREQLDIGATHITNREGALLFSGDDMAIGGQLSDGRAVVEGSANAVTLNNKSATIESLGGMTLAAGTLRNTNEHFAMEKVYLGKTRNTTIQPPGWGRQLTIHENDWVDLFPDGWSKQFDNGATLTWERNEQTWRYKNTTPSNWNPNLNYEGRYTYSSQSHVGIFNKWKQYHFEREEYEDQVVSSVPSLIRTGGNLTLRGEDLLNDKSQIIVGQTLQGDAGNLRNEAAERKRHVSTQETSKAAIVLRNRSTQGSDAGVADWLDRGWEGTKHIGPLETITSMGSVGEVQENASFSSRSADTGDTFAPNTAVSGVKIGNTDTTSNKLADQSTNNTTSKISADSTVVMQTAIDAELVNRAIAPGNATTSASAFNTGTHGATGASLNAHSSSSTTQGTAALSTGTVPVDHASASEGAQATAGLGTQSAPALLLPTSSLFTIDPGSNARYLMATDPGFTDYRQWLSSDYLLSALSYDPAYTQKRLGDGFYEQQLIRDQVAALTGYRFLGNYRSDDAQYADLMNAGVAFAHEHKLRPGIALSASQTALLTNDIVWLVTQTVQLPDGSTTTALMPKVYLAPRKGDLAASGELLGGHNGTLISARDIDLALSGNLNNSGTIAGRKMVDISAQNLNNSGHIQGDIALIDARQDINIDGGSIAANTSMALRAGGNINIASTFHSATNKVDGNTFSLQGIDRVAGLTVSGEAGNLLANAGGAINLTAAELHNIGSGVIQLTAGSDISLDTITIGHRHALNWNPNNYHHQSRSEEVGSVITGGGAVSLTAGQDINLRAATVNAQGALALNAIGGDITLETGQRTDSLAEGRQTRSRGLFSSRTRTTRTSNASTQALASELDGQTVSLISGEDIRVSGANIVADQDLGMHAGGNLNLEAAQNTDSDSHFSHTQKSGLFSGGFGLTIGSQQQESDATSTATFVAPTTVGSMGGNVTLTAGDTYTQIGSDVLAPSGDVLIGANTVDIREGRETRQRQSAQRFKQSGLSLSLSSPVVETGQRLQGQAQAAGNTDSPRMQALAAANSALAVRDIQQQLQGGPGTDLTLNISLGSSQSRSNSMAESNTARGSTLTAGGNLAIHAGNLTVQGSQLEAGNQALLNAAQDINLLASADTASQRSSHNSSSASSGLGIGMNSGSPGIALNLDASRAKGHDNSDSITYNNTQLSVGNQVILTSGGDTTLQGAVVSAPQITTHIGGDLTIASLQDTATHHERHASSGFSASVPITGAGQPSASLNANRTKLNSGYQSVNEQSDLRAGDGGFQVNVEGITTLKGGAITSTQTAIDNDLNHFTTAGQTASEALESGALTLTDIGNNATYDAESISAGLSIGGNDTGLSGIGTGRDDGNASSTTLAAISSLAGNQTARTGDAETGITPIFNADNVRKDVQAQAAITQAFGQQASQAWGDYASQQEAQLWREAQNASDPDTKAKLEAEAARWAEGGAYRTTGHTLLGLTGGGVDGATGALTSSVLMSKVEHLTNDMALPDGVRQGLESLTATLVGAAVGNTSGGAMAFNLDANNRQLHSFEQALAEQLAEGSEYTPEQIAAALRAMYNDELKESPGSHLIVDLQDVAGVDDTYFDYGGEWMATPGEDGATRYLVQQIPKNTSPELISYIIEQTGGESSPYRAPVYQLPPKEAALGQPRDRLTGRPLDEEGRYTVSYVVDGKIYHVKHFSCGDAECVRRNANIDYSDSAAQAWEKALEAKALDDVGKAMTAGVVMTPAGAVGQGLAYAGMGTALLSGYLKDEIGNALSKEVLMAGFEEYAKARGYPVTEARRLTQALNLSGTWDEVMKNGKSILGLNDE